MIPAVTNPNDVVTLLRNLVSIKSYVDMTDQNQLLLPQETQVNEVLIADFIVDFLQKYTTLTVEKQEVSHGRYNIIASNTCDPDLLCIGHIDTVRPSLGGQFDPFSADIVDGKIYGLGAADMKSGIAALLSAISACRTLPKVMLLFYIDEEYDFLGMQALSQKFSHITPKFILSADGNDMTIGHGCRGLVEIHGEIHGKSAHAGRPYEGINAIFGTTDAFRFVTDTLQRNAHPVLGACTVNLARVNGGKKSINPRTGEYSVVDQSNSVPDLCQFIVDIRTASLNVDSHFILSLLQSFCLANDLRLENCTIRHDLGSWFTEVSLLSQFSHALESVTKRAAVYSDPKPRGYVDLQMLWERIGMPPAITFGPGPQEACHVIDEYVKVDSLIQTRDIFTQFITNFN